MENQASFDLTVTKTSIQEQISVLLTIVQNRMYLEEAVQREIMQVEIFLLEMARNTGRTPEELIAAAREKVKESSNLSAIQATRIVAGSDYNQYGG